MRVVPARVSVIVPTHNRPELLRQALASIRALDGPDIDFEIIVADDAQGTTTETIAREFGARLVRPAAQGAAASRNAALRAATGEFVAFLDDDDVWLPGHLRPHLAVLRTDPGVQAVVSQVRNADPTLSYPGPAWPKQVSPDEDTFRAFYRFFPQIGAIVARASVLRTVGYMNEGLRLCEDWDWQLRLALKHRVTFIAVPSVAYRTRPSGRYDEEINLRVRDHMQVFWTNAMRAGRRCPAPATLVGAWAKHRGELASHLIECADVSSSSGDRALARRALRRAFWISPPHCLWLIIARKTLRAAVAPAWLASSHPQP